MKFGSAAWGFRETPLKQQLEITKEIGLDILELGIANAENDIALDADNAVLDNVVKLYKKYDIELLCAATGNDFTNGDNCDVEKIKKVIDMCKYMGIKYLRIFSGFSAVDDVTGDRWDMMIASLSEVIKYATVKNITLVIETHGGVDAFDDGVVHFKSTSSDTATLCKMLSLLPNEARVCYDPANLYALGINNPNEVYEKIKDKVCYVHLKDFVKLPSLHLLPAACGDSDMDWNEILLGLKDYDGPALFEYENTNDIKEGLIKSKQYILNKMEELIR